MEEIQKAGRLIDAPVLEANRGGVVVGVDRDRQRISLSIKRLCADPWEAHVGQLETGQTVDATVTRVMPFGAFARAADGVEGLIHVAELAGERWRPERRCARRRRLSLCARLAERT